MTKLKHFGIALRAVSAALALAVVLVPAVVVVVLAAPSAQAQTYSVLYSFKGYHGKNPYAGLIQDKKGNLYGTTSVGGAYNLGTVFELKTTGKEKVLYSFTSRATGTNPWAGLVRDSDGNLYGTTKHGGTYNYGVVFKLDTTGAETVLHSFTGKDGAEPQGGLVRDSAGNLYGTTLFGGGGGGVVFKLDTTGAETVLYSFLGGADGGNPPAGLVRDSAGNLYGTTTWGGTYWVGVVFKVDTTGAETVLHSFTGGADGGEPYAGLVRDSAGNLYGTTYYGGASGAYGAVFKLDTTGAETVLYSFTGGADGGQPLAGLVRDSAGNLYGTTREGGAYSNGVVFKLDTTGVETVLYSFEGGAGGFPEAGLLRDSAGNLYGTTQAGGAYNHGLVFKITPQ
ncbi:MAG: choice-of-anchor tandem repeat GloVer-containing protein [Terriglobales bacterium]